MEKFDQWIMVALNQTRKEYKKRRKNLDVINRRIRIKSEDSGGNEF